MDLLQDKERAEEKSIRLYDINRMSKIDDNDACQTKRKMDFTTLPKQNCNNYSASSVYTGNGQFYFIMQVDLKKNGFPSLKDS